MRLVFPLPSVRNSELGSVLFEAAFVLPSLFFLVFGIVEFGLVYYQYQNLTNAAREGARFGAAPCPFKDSIQSQCKAGQPPDAEEVRDRTQQFLRIANIQGAKVSVNAAGTVNAACPKDEVVNSVPLQKVVNNVPLQYTSVQICSPFRMQVGQVFDYTVTLRAEAVMRNEDN